MSQAKSRMLFYPEVLTADGRMAVTSPAVGTVRVPGGVNFLIRGIYQVTSVQDDFATAPSKIYHLRWNEVDGFTLRDLADAAYNPSAYPEINEQFDSDYDNMLIARVVTNSSNVATITNLANKHDLYQVGERSDALIIPSEPVPPGAPPEPYTTITINWARHPKVSMRKMDTEVSGLYNEVPYRLYVDSQSRYNWIGDMFCKGYTPGSAAAPIYSYAALQIQLWD